MSRFHQSLTLKTTSSEIERALYKNAKIKNLIINKDEEVVQSINHLIATLNLRRFTTPHRTIGFYCSSGEYKSENNIHFKVEGESMDYKSDRGDLSGTVYDIYLSEFNKAVQILQKELTKN